jgi:hypothetical protein
MQNRSPALRFLNPTPAASSSLTPAFIHSFMTILNPHRKARKLDFTKPVF